MHNAVQRQVDEQLEEARELTVAQNHLYFSPSIAGT